MFLWFCYVCEVSVNLKLKSLALKHIRTACFKKCSLIHQKLTINCLNCPNPTIETLLLPPHNDIGKKEIIIDHTRDTFHYGLGNDKIDPIRNKSHKLYYWEVKLIQGNGITVGISSSNIKTVKDPNDTSIFLRIPSICCWQFDYNMLHHAGRQEYCFRPPLVRKGDTVGCCT